MSTFPFAFKYDRDVVRSGCRGREEMGKFSFCKLSLELEP